jgi:hypothetical protein
MGQSTPTGADMVVPMQVPPWQFLRKNARAKIPCTDCEIIYYPGPDVMGGVADGKQSFITGHVIRGHSLHIHAGSRMISM